MTLERTEPDELGFTEAPERATTTKQAQEPTHASRAPYTPPTLASQTQSTRPSRAELSIETTAQLWQASLATRDEINSALIKVLDTPKSRGQTSLGITRDDGTKASTQAYFLEKFLKANPIPQEELEKGFPSTQQLSVAKKNTNNNPHSVIKSQALRISTAHNFIQPEKSEWRIESTRVQYSSDPKVKKANKIYATAKQIKETPSLFSNAPQFSQFIFGALTGLTMGATLEEFSVVTELTEEAILEAVNHINTSVIPEGIDLKIHNRNGVLIFGTRPATILLDTPETRAVTIDWKTIILAIRERIQTLEAETQALKAKPKRSHGKTEDTPSSTKTKPKKNSLLFTPREIITGPYEFETTSVTTPATTIAEQKDTKAMTVATIRDFAFQSMFVLQSAISQALQKRGETMTLDDIQILKISLEHVALNPETKPFHKTRIIKYLEVLQRRLDLYPQTERLTTLPSETYRQLTRAANQLN